MKLKDKFVDRLVIPITDKQNQILGFTARILPSDDSGRPKYLNSADSDWFHKGSLWFGWDLAKIAIKEKQKVIIVEGNMDVISCHIFGLENVLASQGTAVTREQLKSLKMLTSTIWLAFDNDNAGQISSDKLFVMAQEFDFEIIKVKIPTTYKDIDEYLNQDFKNVKIQIELETQTYLDYLIDKNHPGLISNDFQLQRDTILQLLKLLANCDEIRIDQYLNRISELSNLSVNTLKNIIKDEQQLITKQKSYQDKYDSKITNAKTENSGSLAPVLIAQNPKQATEIKIYLVVWQRICAIYHTGKLESTYQAKIFFLYNLLLKIIPELDEFKTLEDYIERNVDILDLIISNEDFLSEIAYQHRLWNGISQYLDRNHQKFMLDNQAKQYFRQFKNK